MSGRFPGLDSTQASIAAKTCAAILVGYGLALAFQWKASSVATTIIVLQTAALGSTLSKAWARVAGTLGGATAGLVLVALAAHDRTLFILGMALITGGCVWAMQASPYPYAWQLVALTSGIVGWPAASDPLNVFHTGVDRVTAVVAGVVLSSLAYGVFWPVTAAGQFERTMCDLVTGCRGLLRLVRQGLDSGTLDAVAIRRTESKLLALPSSLRGHLGAARRDSQRFRRYAARYGQVADELQEMVLAATSISDAAQPSPSDVLVLLPLLDSADELVSATVGQLVLPRDGTLPRGGTPQHVPGEETANSDRDPVGDAAANGAEDLLVGRIRKFADANARVQAALADVEDPRIPTGDAEPPAGKVVNSGVRLMRSSLAVLQVCLCAWFFIFLNWPMGLQASMMLVMVLACLNSKLPFALLANTVVISVAGALPVAAAFHFGVMPRIDSFLELAPWLALLFFPFLYLSAGRNPMKGTAAMISILLVNSLVSISNSPPSYNFASFMNTYLGMSGGFGLALLLAYLFETRNPRRGFHKLLSALLLEVGDYLKELEEPAGAATERAAVATGYRKQSLHTLGKLRKLAAIVDYGQDPQVSQDRIQAVQQATELVVMRTFWAEDLRTEAEFGGASAARANNWCVESLTAISKTLATLRPTTSRQLLSGVLDDLETSANNGAASASGAPSVEPSSHAPLATYYRSLADAILDCQHKLAAVHWKRWCRDYF